MEKERLILTLIKEARITIDEGLILLLSKIDNKNNNVIKVNPNYTPFNPTHTIIY